mgnify:CR=1 FL=1
MTHAHDGDFRAVLLNLDRDADRLRWMETQLAAAGVAYERQSAVLGKNLPDSLRSYFPDAPPPFVRPLRIGEIGCYASHLLIMQRIAAGELGPVVLVLEDDLRVSTDLAAIIRDILSRLPADWDLVRLSNPPKRATKTVATLADGRELIRYSKIPNSTGAFLVSAAGARKLLKPAPRVLPADEDMRRHWRYGLQEYGVVPAPVQPDILDASTIEALQPKTAHQAAMPAALRKVEFSHLFARPAANIRDLGFGGWLGCLMRNGWDKAARATGLPGRLPQRAPFRITGAE